MRRLTAPAEGQGSSIFRPDALVRSGRGDHGWPTAGELERGGEGPDRCGECGRGGEHFRSGAAKWSEPKSSQVYSEDRRASAGGARLAKLRSPICYETLRRLRSFLLMTDHPMFLEYDCTSNTYRSHLCGAGTSVAHSFETLAASRHALHLIGLRIGDKTDERTWRIEFMEPVAERADFSRLGGWAK